MTQTKIKMKDLILGRELILFVFRDYTPQLRTLTDDRFLPDILHPIREQLNEIKCVSLSLFANAELCKELRVRHNPTFLLLRGVHEQYRFEGIPEHPDQIVLNVKLYYKNIIHKTDEI